MSPLSLVCAVVAQIRLRGLIPSTRTQERSWSSSASRPDCKDTEHTEQERETGEKLRFGELVQEMDSHCYRHFPPPVLIQMLRWSPNQLYRHSPSSLKPPLQLKTRFALSQAFGRKPKSKQRDITFECFTRSSTRAI